MKLIEYNTLTDKLPEIHIGKIEEYYSTAIENETGIKPIVNDIDYTLLRVKIDYPLVIINLSGVLIWTKDNGREVLGDVSLGFDMNRKTWNLLY